MAARKVSLTRSSATSAPTRRARYRCNGWACSSNSSANITPPVGFSRHRCCSDLNHSGRPFDDGPMTNWTVTATAAAQSPLNREYNAEMIGRYWGRPANDAEIDAYERDEQ